MAKIDFKTEEELFGAGLTPSCFISNEKEQIDMAFMSMDDPEFWTNGPEELKHLLQWRRSSRSEDLEGLIEREKEVRPYVEYVDLKKRDNRMIEVGL